MLHLDGSFGGRGRADLPWCLELVRQWLPGFAWDLAAPATSRLQLALGLPARAALAVALLEEADVSEALLQARPELLG